MDYLSNLDKDIATELIAIGIKRVISGHQPHSDSPWIMKDGDITVVTTDTS